MKASDNFRKERKITPPKIRKQPLEIEQHGDMRVDNYAWLRDEKWQEVLKDPSVLAPEIRAVLEAENEYYGAVTDDLEPLRKNLFKEMRGRIKEDDASVPMKDGPWEYWVRYKEGGEYPIFVRAPAGGGAEQIIIDGDKEGAGAAFFDVGDVAQSPDQKRAAIAIDRVGSEYYQISVRDIDSGEELPDRVENADGSGAVWTSDSSAFYYIERDESQRPKRVKLHRLGDDPASDRVVYEEADDGFFLSISKSQSGEFIFISAGSHTTSETRFLSAHDLNAAPVLVEERNHGVEYHVEHFGDEFFILTNAGGAVDFKIVRTPVDKPSAKFWTDWLPHRPGVYVISLIAYKRWLVRLERRDAKPRMVIADEKGAEHEIDFEEEAFSLGVDPGYEFDTDTLRFFYSSPSTPRQTFDYDMKAHKRDLRKTQTVPSGHDASLYVVERLDIPARDGAKIPVVTLRLKSTKKNGSAPLLLYGYGAYGITIPDSFSTNILPMVDRGAVYAVAHIRGGAERGRQWYHDGKRDKKMNSFTDFIDSAEGLIESGHADPKKIVIYGGSAGGLLVGAAVNLRPDLFAGVLGAVPFIDVLNTISDADLPLTPPEWDEWGNPIHSVEQYRWIAEYSPYENVRKADYPPVMATAGLADYRVTYWEPAKWVAQLRDEAKGGPFTLRMNMGAGHGGSAARFEQLDERAHLYAFALKAMGLDQAKPVRHKT